jgi:phage terminase large subunit
LWIEEGEDISDNTLRVLTASVRLSAKDTERLLNGQTVESLDDIDRLLAESDIDMPEIIITMNRGTRDGAIAKQWLERAENELSRCGYYEDDMIMVVEINYTDMPRSWFLASGVEQERLDDEKRMSRAEYRAKWHGDYWDETAGSIIKSEWFDAAIDAHKLDRLKVAFKPHGVRVASYDPMDDGNDAHGYAQRHGSIIEKVLCKDSGEIDEGCDWATSQAIRGNADWFTWDGDGIGTGLKRQVSDAFSGKPCRFNMFRGSLSGIAQDNGEQIYLKVDNEHGKPKTYAETFKNNRAQYYIQLANRFYATYRCVIKGEYVDPSEMISIDSEGVEDMDRLRSELCRIPRKDNNTGMDQIMSKNDMKKLGISSPNMADAIMMALWGPKIDDDIPPINRRKRVIV